jgi:hypothetical protein
MNMAHLLAYFSFGRVEYVIIGIVGVVAAGAIIALLNRQPPTQD